MSILGEALREARAASRTSQRALARRSGVGQAALSRIESGRESPSFERFARLVGCLGLEATVEVRPIPFRGNPADLELARELTPGERVEAAFNAAAFGRELRAGLVSALARDA